MEVKNKIYGAEGIVIYGDNILLGMQKSKRWYQYNNRSSALIKTIGGGVELIDGDNTFNTLKREICEELMISEADAYIEQKPIFHKKVYMKDLNPFDSNSKLQLNAYFYLVKINEDAIVEPNDLPFLFKIPISEFIKYKMCEICEIKDIKKYIIGNKNERKPVYYSFFIPKEVVSFLEKYIDEK